MAELIMVMILEAGVTQSRMMQKVEMLLRVCGDILCMAGTYGSMTPQPSSIGIGSMLKTKSSAFAWQAIAVKKARLVAPGRGSCLKILNRIPKAIARSRLDNGPAADTNEGWCLFLYAQGFTGTAPQAMPKSARHIRETGPMTRSGFNVMKPFARAVLSPKKDALAAWLNSWTQIENATETTQQK